MSIADIRQNYKKFELLESSVANEPYAQFALWLDQAIQSQLPEPTAMALATANSSGKTSVRMVLLKGFDTSGFVFYTNYESRKGRDLQANPAASLLFFWPQLERQVRIVGEVQKVSPAESDEYYDSRPLGSRIGAWASPQSRPVSHAELAQKVQSLSAQLGAHPARPDFWGGFRLQASEIEFWQGRPSRLHDRLVYTNDGSGNWSISRIAP